LYTKDGIVERSVDLLAGLNPSQQRAVTTVDGPVLALAGPGSGKTRVLTHRIAYLIHEKRVHPSTILSVTFTNKAAREMRERMAKLIGERAAEHVSIGTFHSLAARWLRRDARSVDLADGWVIYDDDDQQRLMKRLIKERNLPEKTFTSRAVLSAISSAKSELLDVQTYARASRSPESRIYAELYGQYQQALRIAGAVDFDDLLLYGLALARQERYQNRFAYVLVDEYQDTNKAQYEMVRALSRGAGNIFVVGDDDQSIYGWRGADVRNIRQFETDFPGAQVILLPENYRSTKSILDVAQKLIDASPKRLHSKVLKSQSGDSGEPVLWRECSDQNDESQRVCDAIERLVKSGAARYADCAVMYRTNAQSRAFEEALGRRRIPYVLVGGMRFYERREVKDLLAWMRIMANPDDDVSLERALDFPNSGIGQSSLTHLQQWARAHAQSVFGAMVAATTDSQAIPALKGAARQRVMAFGAKVHHLRGRVRTLPLNDAFDAVLSETKFTDALTAVYDASEADARIENINELRRVSGEYLELPVDEQLFRFLEEVALVADVDTLANGEAADRDNRVVCITMHQAKGLEYDNVFIVGLEDELIPHSRTHLFPEQIDEERRILYVGVTRARKRLMLSRAERRMMFGQYGPTMVSRFVKDIKDMLQVTTGLGSVAPAVTQRATTTKPEYRGWGDAAKFQSKPSVSNTSVDFGVGDRVRHQRFGEGIVMSAKVVDDDVEVVVHFADKAVGEKRLIASFARLEKI
jgi:DNA helicase II / ATP-dependent DNA helicase PcrA